MESHFDKPQRQSLLGVLILFFDTIRQYIRALWPILIIWIFKFNEINKVYLSLGTLLIFIGIAVIAYLKYLNFTYYLDYQNEEFVVNEGVFNKTKTTIQLNKIQQVNINQSLLQRIIGVYALDVDTAGSAKKEGKIKAISHELAIELKAALLDNEKRTIDIETDVAPFEPQIAEVPPFINISFLSLLKVGITSNYVKSLSLLLLFFITASDYINKFTGRDVLNDQNIENYVDKNLVLQTFLIAIVFLFCTVLIINVVRIVFRYFDYKIAKQKGSLLLSFGLLNTKSTIVKPEKVQITTVSRNYFQKKMNILELKIKQATGGEREQRESAIEIPGCNEKEQNEILKLLFHKIPEKGVMLKPNFRKLVFSIFLSIVLPLSGFFIAGNYIPELMDYAYFTLIYVIFIGLINYFGFRNNRLFINDDFIIKQSGAWDISNEIIEPMKIQAITVAQLFWHKSANIGYITIHTAGGNIAFQLGDYTKIKEYVNLWLYRIETSNSNWM
jgi:putative membrane protein